jgi:dienelactone hydrolase
MMIASQTIPDWETQKPVLRESLWKLLGNLPPRFTPQVRIVQTIQREQYTIEKIEFDNGAGATVYGYLLLPHNLNWPAPAVLFHHFHAGWYHLGKDELFLDRVIVPPLGPSLAAEGYVVLAVDAYGFGERQRPAPVGKNDAGAAVELALAKQFLWEGRTYWGMIVRDDWMALDYLCSRPEVDPARIAATGMSMGASRTTWLSALDERIKVAIPVAQMTRYQDFAIRGNLTHHGIYYYVPGVLASGLDMEHIASLTAPRAQIVLIGDADQLSPIEGVHKIDTFVHQIYALYGAAERFQTIIYPGVEHEYTPAMFAAVIDSLRRFL